MANFWLQDVKMEEEVCWQPPKPPWYKVNVDADVFEQFKGNRTSVVIWDHKIFVIATLRKRFLYQWAL